MKTSTEYLLGFDARYAPPASFDTWSSSRKAQFLLRQDIVAPLSTDNSVWPSVFDYTAGSALNTLFPPAWTGANVGMWDNLERLTSCLHKNSALLTTPVWIIATTWFIREPFHETRDVGPYPEPTMPPSRSKIWTLLGYDISDGSLLSGLTNCGYSPAEAQTLSTGWGSVLNHYHLFGSRKNAFKFATVANARVPEHAPFFVYGLWRSAVCAVSA